MKMNPKASALNAMAEEGGNYKEPKTKAEDVSEDTTEGETEDTCCVKCSCGASLLCADCGKSTCECDC
jgi:hypothetical protein